MRKGSDLIGKRVIAFDTGEAFERIDDLIFDQQSNTLLGFLVDEGGWFGTANVIALDSVQSIGPDAVIVSSKKAEISAEQMPVMKRILEQRNVLRGTKIMTTDGRDLGTLVDLYFDEKTGMIEGYEVSGGVFADAYNGRAFVPAPQTIKIGEDVAFVPPETADLMEEQVGGIKAAVQTAQTSLTNATAATTIEETRGQRVQHAVRTDEGLIIAAPGQIVTDAVINRARTYHKEQALLDSVGLSASDAARARVSTVDDRLRQGTNSLWERVKSTVSDARQRTSQELEEQRIKDALGRPTSRVILDPQDNVILNVGEIITHQAVDRSRQAGVLDILLSSVYDKEPDITKEEMRAPETGSASLEHRTTNQ